MSEQQMVELSLRLYRAMLCAGLPPTCHYDLALSQ
jgi:putative component of membrane protein insertase Oxa1/YidC/SpoIIIJ protein YidD